VGNLLLTLAILYGVAGVYAYLQVGKPQPAFGKHSAWSAYRFLWAVLTGMFIAAVFLQNESVFASTSLMLLWVWTTAAFVAGQALERRFGGALLSFVEFVSFFLALRGAFFAYAEEGAGLPGSETTFDVVVREHPWLFLHIGLAFLAYLSFAAAGVLAFLYLLQEHFLRRNPAKVWHVGFLPLADLLRRARFLVRGGFFSLALAAVLGIWEAYARGFALFSDPKVVGTLFLLIFLVVSLRRSVGWRMEMIVVFAFFLLVFANSVLGHPFVYALFP